MPPCNKQSSSGGSCHEADPSISLPAQAERIEKTIHLALQKSTDFFTNSIPEGESVYRYENTDSFIQGRAFQPPVSFTKVPPLSEELFKMGEQKAAGNCKCGVETFGVKVNNLLEGQCNDSVCTVYTSSGFGKTRSEEFKLRIQTPVLCVEDLAGIDNKLLESFYKMQSEDFVKIGKDSFENELATRVIENSTSNTVVLADSNGHSALNLSTNGWDMGMDPNDPIVGVQHLSLPYAQAWAEEILREEANIYGAASSNAPFRMLISEAAFKDMMRYDMYHMTSPGAVYPGTGSNIHLTYENIKEGNMAGMKMAKIGNIEAVFTNTPIKGFAKRIGTLPNGNPKYTFVRINPYMNVPAELGGMKAVRNPDYYSQCVLCDGILYNVLEGAVRIHKDSFYRNPIKQTKGPSGLVVFSNGFNVKLIHGDSFSASGCENLDDALYKFYMRGMYRFGTKHAGLSGVMLFVPPAPINYTRTPDIRCRKTTNSIGNMTPESCPCTDETRCRPECGEPAECNESSNFINLSPCGPVQTSYNGEFENADKTLVRFKFTRDAKCAEIGIATATYAITGSTAISGTHFTPVSVNGTSMADTGVLTWEAGESGVKEVLVRIDGGMPNDAEGNPVLATFSVRLESVIGATIGECTTCDASILNMA